MADHFKSPLTRNLFFLLSCTAAVVAASSPPQLSYKTNQELTAPSHYPQPHDFPNERLYQAYSVIQRFKNTITCDPMNITSTWTGHDICGKETYVGFYCTSLPGQGQNLTVTSAVFNGFGLCAPKLQGFVDQLPDLALFQASSNNFGAFDVPRLARLTYLYKFDTSDDQFPRSLHDRDTDIPTRNLVSVHICVNGRCVDLLVPAASLTESTGQNRVIARETDARALLLNNDNLSGPLPANIGFSKLSYLAVANNKLTGPIPPSIAHMQDSLLEVLLLNNQLSGCLPNELGMLTKTAVIDAGMNQLTGPIPSFFSCLSSVEQLNLGGNRLYGQVPDALCKLAGPAGHLSNLTLSGNYFTSVGPACSALIKNGVLDVKQNCIPGFANQRSPAECASFLSQPKTCPSASARVACPAADAQTNAAAPGARVAKDYSSYVVYATLHE
nr:Rpt5 [Cloning vector IHP_0513_pBract202_pMla6_Spt1C_tMla6]